MDNFIVSARKYRPNTFDTVVGQQAITDTLKNAIKSNHLAQAFLFTGPRGVGKTTSARVLAKTINCFSVTQNIEACDECESCKSFNEGRSLNIYELDAASNNSVEDIRNLIEQVRFAPQLGTHKVYIIDEVHMLSQAAFNAFLKTLEEPPKHAIFILATTEKHKIIPTILSRCQVFDFNRIQIEDIAKHLLYIAKKENITAEEDAMHIIAQKADGALRDALSMFDQIVSFSGKTITYQNVIENLNILDYDYYFKVTDAVLNQDIANCLLLFNEILNNGFDGHNFINGLSEHFRNLLVCQDNKTENLLEVGVNVRNRYKEQATTANLNNLIAFLSITSKADTSYKTSQNHRLLVEVMLMQLCSLSTNIGEKKSPIINLPLTKVISHKDSVIKTPQAITTNVQEPIIKSPILKEVSTEKVSTSNNIVKEIQKEAPPLVKKTNLNFANTVSINSNIKEKKIAKEVLDSSIKPAITFTEQQFFEKWKLYKEKLQKEGKIILASAFENLPEVDGNNILLTIENKSLEDNFNNKKGDILAFLKTELKNFDIQITTQINKDIKNKKAYTPQEKFDKMKLKNPTLVILKQKLDMDVDYT